MIVAIVQARISSTRLPGKVLEPILGAPMLTRQLERIARAKRIDQLVVATSDRADDEPIERLCKERSIPAFRGAIDDVLDRFYKAALPYHADHVVRLTGDCPLTDAGLIDDIIGFHVDGGFDYASNTLVPTYPDGLDVEVMRHTALARAWREAQLPSEREHVTPYLKNRASFRVGNFTAPVDRSHLRWTVDEPEDLALIRDIYAELYPRNHEFTSEDVYALLRRRPELETVNQMHIRDAGYQLSLQRDRQRSAP